MNKDIEREIEETAIIWRKKNYHICSACDLDETEREEIRRDASNGFDGYKDGAREFIKRTEERVWLEAMRFVGDYSGSICNRMDNEGKRKGYIK